MHEVKEIHAVAERCVSSATPTTPTACRTSRSRSSASRWGSSLTAASPNGGGQGQQGVEQGAPRQGARHGTLRGRDPEGEPAEPRQEDQAMMRRECFCGEKARRQGAHRDRRWQTPYALAVPAAP